MRALALLLLGGCQVVFPLEDDGCGASYDLESEDSRYHLDLDAKRTWQEAEELCEARARPGRGHLAIPDSATELAFIKGLITPAPTWLGIAREVTPDPAREDFRAITGDDVPSVLWASNEPDNADGDERVAAVANDSQLFDVGHQELQSTICECDGKRPIAFDWQ